VPEIVNAEMAAAWDGAQGDHWVAVEPAMTEALAPYADHLLAAAAVGRDEHVLDVGCGTGDTTHACAALAVDGGALGIDLSTAMLERARTRAADAGLTNVEFERGDAQVYPFVPERSDLVVSRFGVMFFADPVAAFVNIGRGMKPGGRLALVVWNDPAHNEWFTAARGALTLGRSLPIPPPGAPGPYGMADREHTRGVLEAAGFGRVAFDDVEVPFRFGPDADAAFEFGRGIGFVREMIDSLDDDQRAEALDALRAVMDARDAGAGVVFDSRIWVITAVR
jgi:SAM-dependent methyltransferase